MQTDCNSTRVRLHDMTVVYAFILVYLVNRISLTIVRDFVVLTGFEVAVPIVIVMITCNSTHGKLLGLYATSRAVR